MVKNQKRGGLPQARRTSALQSRNQESNDGLLALSIKSAFFGLLVWAISGILLISAATAAAYANPDPLSLAPPLSLAATLISAFLGGFAAQKKAKESPLVCGLVFGGLAALVSMFLCFILKNTPSSNYAFWQSALLHGAMVIFSLFGALAGNAKGKMKTKRRFG